MPRLSALFLLCVGWLLCSTKGAVEEDRILSLPGWDNELPSAMYSGYLTAQDSRLFYWFIEAEGGGGDAPFITWFNGGPGCSSLGGLFTETGPFSTNGTQLLLSEFRWSRFANLLVFENPKGVGFSYSTTLDYNISDDLTAHENLLALGDFFSKFPEYSSTNRALYLAGESYAGVYIPMLAQAILHAEDGNEWNGPRLTGVAVGNGCTGSSVGVCSSACESVKYNTEFLLGLSFIDVKLKASIAQNCDWSKCGLGSVSSSLSSQCQDDINTANLLLGPVNVYGVYDSCVNSNTCGSGSSRLTPVHATDLLREARGAAPAARGSRRTQASVAGDMGIDDDIPAWAAADQASGGPSSCIDSSAATAYLMNSDVQAAIHAKPLPEGFCWSFCGQQSNDWNYEHTMTDEPTLVYPDLLGRIDVLIYNGDVDDCVPWTDNQAWTAGMGYPVKTSWRPWYFSEVGIDNANYSKQLGGYMVEYQPPINHKSLISGGGRFFFATVSGSGHMVPAGAPNKAFDIISRFVHHPMNLYQAPETKLPSSPRKKGSSSALSSDSSRSSLSPGAIAGLVVMALITFTSLSLSLYCLFIMRRRGTKPPTTQPNNVVNPLQRRLDPQQAAVDAIPSRLDPETHAL